MNSWQLAALEDVDQAKAAAWATVPPWYVPEWTWTDGQKIQKAEMQKLDARAEAWEAEAAIITREAEWDVWFRRGIGLVESYQVWSGSPAQSAATIAGATVAEAAAGAAASASDAAGAVVDFGGGILKAQAGTLRWATVAIVAAAVLALVWLVAPARAWVGGGK